jgi:chromosomal replication initiation ATPase DnaA
MSQYPLTLHLPPVFSEDNFFVSSCNETAYQWVARWPDWPDYALVLYGAGGSGKSHLSAIWAQKSGAAEVAAGNLGAASLLPAHTPIYIENIETLRDEVAFFHLLNSGKADRRALLLTSAVAPGQCGFMLPDLISRLLALPSAEISPPDDAALAACLRKQFADKQLMVEDEVILFLITRMERSYEQAKQLVEVLDKQALMEKKTITIPFVRKILAN